jgi:hypothetical protein
LNLKKMHQVLTYADDVNILANDIDSTDSKEVGLEIIVEQSTYMLLSRQGKACQNRAYR